MIKREKKQNLAESSTSKSPHVSHPAIYTICTMAHAWPTTCHCVLQTSVASERAERTPTTAAEQDGAHSTDANGDSNTKPAQTHLEQNGSANTQPNSATAAEAEHRSTGLPSAPRVNGLDLHPAPQPEEKTQGAAADSASGAAHQQQPPLSDKEREVVNGSGGEEKGGFKFSKGAYFIGKAVWGKVPTLWRFLLHSGHGTKAQADRSSFKRIWQ